jgi:hypothetical protein
MINSDIVNYIKQQRAQGIPDEEIQQTLRGAGWQEGDIHHNPCYLQENSYVVPLNSINNIFPY